MNDPRLRLHSVTARDRHHFEAVLQEDDGEPFVEVFAVDHPPGQPISAVHAPPHIDERYGGSTPNVTLILAVVDAFHRAVCPEASARRR